MKRILFIIALYSIALQAQNIKFSFSTDFETVKKYQDLGFHKLDNKTYADIYYRNREGMIFQTFDEKFMKLKSQETVKLAEENDTGGNEGFHYVKGHHYWFYATWDRDSQTERLFALPFNKKTMQFDGKAIKMIETNKLESFMGMGKYSCYYSTDTAMLLVTYKIRPTEKRAKNIIDIVGYNLYNSDMKLLYAGEIAMPYSRKDMSIKDYQVDSKGNIFMLTTVKLNNAVEGDENAESDKAVRYELLKVNKETNKLETTKISLDNKYISDVILDEDKKHDMIITGYYSNNEKSVGVNGAYIIRVELDDMGGIKSMKTTYSDFPKDVIESFVSERAKKKMEKKDKDDNLEAAHLELRKVSFNDDGSLLIIGEEYDAVTRTYTSSSGTHSTTSYYIGAILVMKTDRDGKTIWCTKIPKRQQGMNNTSGLGFYHHQVKGQDYFFYLDNVKNKNLSPSEVPAVHTAGQGGYLIGVKLDENGKMTKQYVFDSKEQDVKVHPENFVFVGENLIVERLKEDKTTSKVFRLEIPMR